MFVLLDADKLTTFAVVIAVVSKLLELAWSVPVLVFAAMTFASVLFVADKFTTFAVVIAVASKLLELA